IQVSPRQGEPISLAVSLRTGSKPPPLKVAWFTNEDARLRAFPLHRFVVPWAPTGPAATAEVMPEAIPQLKGGDWARGRQVFFSEEASCSRCHQVGGNGGKIGPDLSNLIHRDYDSVLRDIREPSAAIHPEHITHLVELKNGQLLTGVLRTVEGKLIVGDAAGQEH